MQMALFALVGFSSALVNLGVYNFVLWALQSLGWFSGFDFLIAQFFGFVISVAWAFFFNRRYVFCAPGAPWKESLIKVYITYSITGIGLSSLLSLMWPRNHLNPGRNDEAGWPINHQAAPYTPA